MKHLRRKACSLLCIIALLTSLMPVTAWADDSTIEPWTPPSAPEEPTAQDGTWTDTGNYDTSWYNDGDTKFTLNDAADLAGLAVIVNGLNGYEPDNFAGKIITLAANTTFDLSTHTWTPIGTSSNVDEYFKGTFYGNSENGTTITRLTILDASGYNGLFAFVNSATIKNVTLTNGYISLSSNRYTRVGGIVGHVTGTTTIENCSFEGTIDASDGSSKEYNNIGGIVGETYSQVTIKDCRTDGTIFGNGYYMGGIVGYTGGTDADIDVTITHCTNEAEIRPYRCTAVGGILGYDKITGRLTMDGCTNSGAITPSVFATNLGGIVGRIDGMGNAAITGCTNSAALTSENSENMGGIVGYSNQKTTITDCHNSGTVTNSSVGEYPELTYTGGILGRMETKDLSVKQCSNTGDISGSAKNDAYVGGIVGQFYRVGGNIEECYNAGACRVTSAQNYAFVGGLIGDSSNNSSALTLQNSYNVGTISNAASSSYSYIGGLIGRANNSSIKNCYNAGEIKETGNNVGAIAGSVDTNSTVTNCYYWSDCGAAGAGTGKTANDMTEDDAWATNLGLDTSVWEKAKNASETTGNLPVLTNNEQKPAPTLTREAKQTQTGFAITGQPSEQIYETKGSFKLATEGGQSNGAVTWSTSNSAIASVDQNGTVTIHGVVGPVTITATKAGNDIYADAIATYSFTVYGTPISEVEISNLKAPVFGENPVTEVRVPDGAPYVALDQINLGGSTGTANWYDIDGNQVNKGENFVKGKVYKAVIRLQANTYYSFANDIEVVHTPGFTPGTVDTISIEAVPNQPNQIDVVILFKPTAHEHKYDTNKWAKDPLHHWHACTENDCPLMPSEMPDYASHTGNPGDKCSVCGAIIGYEITFDANGGQCDTTSMYTDTTGKLSALPTPTRGGYTFDGWFTEKSGGTAVTAETVYSANTTLYAHWTALSSGSSSYSINVLESVHGTVTASPKWASKGRIVTLTVTPDEGYKLAALAVTDKDGNKMELTNNGDGTYTFKMPASKVTVTATFTKDIVTLPFIDVHPGDWFYDPVCYVYSQGLMTGTAATLFEPDTALSRAMLVAVLHRLEGSPTASGSDFTDVADGDWYAQAVNWAASVGVVNGFDDGTFQPNAAITREQMAAILRNYAEYKGLDVTASGDFAHYTDAASVSDWAKDSVQWMIGSGLIGGYEDSTLRPQGTTTRAEVASVLQRALGNVAGNQ